MHGQDGGACVMRELRDGSVKNARDQHGARRGSRVGAPRTCMVTLTRRLTGACTSRRGRCKIDHRRAPHCPARRRRSPGEYVDACHHPMEEIYTPFPPFYPVPLCLAPLLFTLSNLISLTAIRSSSSRHPSSGFVSMTSASAAGSVPPPEPPTLRPHDDHDDGGGKEAGPRGRDYKGFVAGVFSGMAKLSGG